MPVVLHAKDSHSPTASIRTEIWAIQGIWKNSSRVELECGTTPAGRRRSSSSRREVFDGPLSGQSVYEQTSGFLRHTESVRGVKIQEQDWVSDTQVLTLRTLADARSNDQARSQASVSSRAIASCPPSRPGSRARRKKFNAGSKDLEVRSAVKADESFTKIAIPKVLYVVMGCSGTSVLSTRWRRGAKPLAAAAAANEKTLRRLCNAIVGAVSRFSTNVDLSAPGNRDLRRVSRRQPLRASRLRWTSPFHLTGNFNIHHFGPLSDVKILGCDTGHLSPSRCRVPSRSKCRRSLFVVEIC